ncbi:MAG: restriction endonuclease subunit S [Nitrospirae bacterium]|nr:restriction endonuclease subunit S [Nitrospirota bacterium]
MSTAQKNINLEILSDVAVPLPPVYEQKQIIEEIERRLSVAEEIEETININLNRAERLRQAILKKAFSGRLV